MACASGTRGCVCILIEAKLAEYPEERRDKVVLLFSAHRLPTDRSEPRYVGTWAEL